MVTFRNNNKRSNFRRNDRGFKNNNNRRNNFRRGDKNFKTISDRTKIPNTFSNNENFQRKFPSRNNQNASKLVEKYNNLAREALSSGDKILSENYFQHADHFARVLNEKESLKKVNKDSKISEETNNNLENTEKDIAKTEVGNNQLI